VISNRTRAIAALLMLACAGTHAAVGSGVSAGALALALYSGHPHAHAVEVQFDGRHLDVVLSHSGRASEGARACDHGGVHRAALAEVDHVVHIEASGSASALERRVHSTPDSTPRAVIHASIAENVAAIPAHTCESCARPVELQRTIVLRI